MSDELKEAWDKAREKVESLEDDPPKDLKDWPDDEAKYKTFGGPEGETSYEEGPTSDLGPSGVRHHDDGSVSVDGEKVDNPDDYKGEPIPGGPSDPDAPPDPAMIGQDEDDEKDAASDSDSDSSDDEDAPDSGERGDEE